MQTGHINVLSAKMRKFIEIEEREALVGTIKFGRPAHDRDERGGRFVRKPNFAIPVPCSERPISADGRVAFHFKHSFVVKKASYAGSSSKSGTAMVGSGDSESFSTDAADHERYISREAAVMAISAASYEQYIEAGGLKDRGGAVFSNIHPLLERRVEYWVAAAQAERNPSPDVVTIHVGRATAEQWRKVFEGELADTPIGQLAEEFAAQTSTVNLAGASKVTCQLEHRHFVTLRKRLKAMKAWDHNHPPITIKRGRGGRVQRRMVAEFPLGIDEAARVRIAGRFAGWLGDLRMMYTAVIHAPDHHNDSRNFHLHVAANDRPSRYLEDHGCWDFKYSEVVPGQHKRVRFPKRQNKVSGLTRPLEGDTRSYRQHGADLLTAMREKFASLCNEELSKVGINRLFDHRSYAAMGIDQKPGKHLGTKAASLEAAGVPTLPGIENAQRSWQGAFDRAVREDEVRRRLREDCRAQASEALGRLLKVGMASPLIGELAGLVDEFDGHVEALADQELALAQLRLTAEMAYSRADKTSEICQRFIEAIENGTATVAEMDAEDDIRARLKLATEHQNRIFDATHAEVALCGELADGVAARRESLKETMKAMRDAADRAEKELLAAGQVRETAEPDPMQPTSWLRKSRHSRELAAYFSSPLDYEDEWNEVFDRISLWELEIKPPSEKTPHFHVPGIDKDELDRLLNPIFYKRSQGRLRAMYRTQRLNELRSLKRAQSREAATSADVTKAVEPIAERPQEPQQQAYVADLHIGLTAEPSEACAEPYVQRETFDQMLKEKIDQIEKDRAEAVNEWFAWFLARFSGERFPLRSDHGQMVFDLEMLPDDRRQFAEVFSDRLMPLVSRRLDGDREVLRHWLPGRSRVLVEMDNGRAVYDLRDFPQGLHLHLDLLLQSDPVVRGFVEAAPAEIASRRISPPAPVVPKATIAPQQVTAGPAVVANVSVVDQALHLAGRGRSR